MIVVISGSLSLSDVGELVPLNFLLGIPWEEVRQLWVGGEEVMVLPAILEESVFDCLSHSV